MSNSIAAAKRRRAGNINQDNVAPPGSNTCSPNTNNSVFQQSSSTRMSIPNYLALMEKKIIDLEQKIPSNEQINLQIEVDGEDGKRVISMTEYMEDMDKKFNLLVDEMSTLKETIMDLQRFTMNVNSKLVNNVFPNDNISYEIKEKSVEEVN